MRWSLATSLIIHTCILLAAVVVLPSPDEYDVEELESVPVDIVTLEEFSQRLAKQENAPEPEPEQKIAPKVDVEPEVKEPTPKPAEEIKKAVLEPQPELEPKPVPEPEPVAEPEPPKLEPIEELIKKTEEVVPEPELEAKPEKKAKAPVPLPRAKPKNLTRKVAEKKKKKKSKFNPDDIAAYLNKTEDERAAPPVSDVLDGAPNPDDITSLLGSDSRDTASEAAWMRQRVYDLFIPLPGGNEAIGLFAKVEFKLDRAGNVIGQPRIIDGSFDHPLFPAYERNAVAAVLSAQPYDKLSPETYNDWAKNRIRFSPEDMRNIN